MQKFKVGVVTASRDRVGTLKGAPAIGSLSPAGCLVTPLGEPLSGVPGVGQGGLKLTRLLFVFLLLGTDTCVDKYY